SGRRLWAEPTRWWGRPSTSPPRRHPPPGARSRARAASPHRHARTASGESGWLRSPAVSSQKNDRRALRAWAMYDWANSAYATVIAGAVLPAYFVEVVVPGETYRFLGREWAADGLWGLVAGAGPLVMFLLIPVLGAIADFSASKK